MLPVLAATVVAATLVVPSALAAPGTAPGPPSASSGGPVRWTAPLEPALLVARFDPPARRWLAGHRGADLAGSAGQAVRAAGAGTVTWAGTLVDRGVVVVTHPGGLRTTYEPVDAVVGAGDRVERGQVIGVLGAGDVHCGGEPRCLHWGLRRGRDYLDPWLLLHPGRAVLLPP